MCATPVKRRCRNAGNLSEEFSISHTRRRLLATAECLCFWNAFFSIVWQASYTGMDRIAILWLVFTSAIHFSTLEAFPSNSLNIPRFIFIYYNAWLLSLCMRSVNVEEKRKTFVKFECNKSRVDSYI